MTVIIAVCTGQQGCANAWPSGSTIKSALSLGRRAIGVELEEERFNQTVNGIERLQKPTSKQ